MLSYSFALFLHKFAHISFFVLFFQIILHNFAKNNIIPDENIDTALLTVDISPTAQSSETDTYSIAKNVTNADSTSRIYYLEETDDMRYRIIFGDGSIGRRLIDGEYIRTTYISTDGVEANGAKGFDFIGNVIDSDARAI